MVYKKVKKRNSASTLTGLVMTLLLVIGMFFGGYLYIAEHSSNAGITIEDKYQDIYDNLDNARSDLNKTTDDIKENLDDIEEAKDTFQVAWNGLKGLGNTLKLPVQFISTTIAVWSASITFLDFTPSWVLSLATIALVSFVVFLVLRVLKGEPAV